MPVRLFKTIGLFALAFAVPARAGTAVAWKGGDGEWEDAARWGGAFPARMDEVQINGRTEHPSHVSLSHKDVLVNHVSIAADSTNAASLTLEGTALTVGGAMDVGKYNGSEGRLVLDSGALFAGTIFLSGGGGPGMRGRGTVEVRGGSIVTKDIELGVSAGCRSTLRIIGSKASAIVVEDGLHIGVYNYLNLEREPPPSATDLIFEIDADGVTPIFTWGSTEGRVNFPVPDTHRNGVGTCRLEVNLLAAPPSGDILLIGATKQCRGAFTGLPEGGVVQAEFGGRTFQWKLTYRGGTSRHDILLTDARVQGEGGHMVSYVSAKPAKRFLFDHGVVESAYRRFYRQWDAEQTPVPGGPLAFPGAEGYGAHARGGRGGKVFLVTNLKDSGPGSLREAVEAKGPRTVIFRVGGVIETKGIVIREPYITIAGQTAPGDGICILKGDGGGDALQLSGTHDVVIRYLRIRAGRNTGAFRCDALRVYDSQNFIIDHCSCSWGNPETLSASGTVDCYTVQWCIASEGNDRQRHAFATILGGDRSTWHHNLFAHMLSRVPRWGDITVQCDFRNNVIYDWGHTCGYGDLRTLNYVNNFLRPGPSTTQHPPFFIIDPKVALPASIYIRGNVMAGRSDMTEDNWKGIKGDRALQATVAFPCPPVLTQSAPEAFESVLKRAGAALPKRDAIDARIVSNVRKGDGKIIDSEKEVGGCPAYAPGDAPLSSAGDGIPDSWKKVRGVPLDDPSVGNKVDEAGYTLLEEYLNSVAASP